MFWGCRWGINKDFSLSQPIKKGGKVGKLGEYCTRTTQYKHKRKEGRRTPTINGTPTIANDKRTEDQGEQGRTWGEQGSRGKTPKISGGKKKNKGKQYNPHPISLRGMLNVWPIITLNPETSKKILYLCQN